MKKYFLLLFLFIPLYLFSNAIIYTELDEYYLRTILSTKLGDFNLKGNIKEYTEEFSDNSWKYIYYFDQKGKIIKKDLFYDKNLEETYEYIYNKEKLEEIIMYYYNYSSTSKTTTKEGFKYKYDENGKLIEVIQYINQNHHYKYVFDYKDINYRINVYYLDKRESYIKPNFEYYFVIKYENNILSELVKYSIKDKIKYKINYNYNENNYIKELIIKEGYVTDTYTIEQFNNKNNSIEENIYIKIGKKSKRILSKINISYTYYE